MNLPPALLATGQTQQMPEMFGYMQQNLKNITAQRTEYSYEMAKYFFYAELQLTRLQGILVLPASLKKDRSRRNLQII